MGFNTMTLQEMRDASDDRKTRHEVEHDQRDNYEPRCTFCRRGSYVIGRFMREQLYAEWQDSGDE